MEKIFGRGLGLLYYASMVDDPNVASGFATTRWTLVQSLREGTAEERDRAISALTARYWPAIYAALRRQGKSIDTAAEVTQAFFAEVVFSRQLFARAEPERGRLRSLLLTALKRFQVDQHRKSGAPGQWAANGSGQRSMQPMRIDLTREEAFLQREADVAPDQVFERRWAVAMLEEALARCEQHFRQSGNERHWLAFHAAVVLPATHGNQPPPLNSLAKALEFPSPVHVASATKVVRKRLRLLLREVAAEHADDAEGQEHEYQRLLTVLRDSSPLQ